MLAFRVPVLCSLCDLFLGADHFKVSGFLLRSMIHRGSLSRAYNLDIRLFISPFLSPLFHCVISDLLSLLFFLKLFLGALNMLWFLSTFFVEVLCALNDAS
jgi:hypothetical protein